MSIAVIKSIKPSEEIRIGTQSAQQPLSGVKLVGANAVNGLGNGGYVRLDETTKKSA